MSTHPQHRFDPLTAAFVSNLESLILDFQPAAWISGHTHYCSDYRIGETRMISNQRGYSDLDDTGGFDPVLVFEIPTSTGCSRVAANDPCGPRVQPEAKGDPSE